MSTLREVIKARINELSRQITTIQAESRTAISPLQEEIDQQQNKLSQFGPWLDRSLADVKADMTNLFDTYDAQATAAEAVKVS